MLARRRFLRTRSASFDHVLIIDAFFNIMQVLGESASIILEIELLQLILSKRRARNQLNRNDHKNSKKLAAKNLIKKVIISLHFPLVILSNLTPFSSLRIPLSSPTDPLSSTHRFHQRAAPFKHPKSLSSTQNPLSFWCGTEGCVELRGFRC